MADFADRIAAYSATTGTGSMTLGAAVTSYRTWAAGIADGAVSYGIVDQATGDWEVGLGTLSAAGTLLARDTVLASSAGGAKVPWSAGDKVVFSNAPSAALSLDMGEF